MKSLVVSTMMMKLGIKLQRVPVVGSVDELPSLLAACPLTHTPHRVLQPTVKQRSGSSRSVISVLHGSKTGPTLHQHSDRERKRPGVSRRALVLDLSGRDPVRLI